MNGLLRVITGYRDDVNLPGKWWHRLISVGYVIAAVGLVLFVGMVLWNATPDATVANVTIKATLAGSFTTDPRINAAQVLDATPGALGLRRPDGAIEPLSDFGLERTFCTSNAFEVPDQIADHLNEINYTKNFTKDKVLASLKEDERQSQLCWFHSSLNDDVDNASWDNIIKYEFTPAAKAQARAKQLVQAVLWLLLAHVVMVTLYHRGFVYIVCGPRRRHEQPEPTLQ